MSKNIPLDRALTDGDRHYLRQRGSWGADIEKRIDTAYPPDPETLAAFEIAERAAHAKVNGAGPSADDLAAALSENERLRAELAALRSGLNDSDEDDNEVPNYTGWTKAQLEAEVDRVNGADEAIVAGTRPPLAKGKVADMVTTLTEYFTE